jgi:fatty acid desaturase
MLGVTPVPADLDRLLHAHAWGLAKGAPRGEPPGVRSMSRHTRARINVVAVVTFAFMAALFGTAVACGTLALWALFAGDERFAPYLLVGSTLYLVGTILLTIIYYVPRLLRAAKRSIGERGAARSRRRELLARLPLGLDRVEPHSGRGGPRCIDHAHHRAPSLEGLGGTGDA